LLILVTGLQSLIVDRFRSCEAYGGRFVSLRRSLRNFAFSFLFKIFPESIAYALIYLLNDQQWRFFPVVFWILVNDIFDPRLDAACCRSSPTSLLLARLSAWRSCAGCKYALLVPSNYFT